MSDWLKILEYRDFHDFPRMFIVRYDSILYLFDCPFDEVLDEYADKYDVYVMPDIPKAIMSGDWSDLHRRAEKHVGNVPVNKVVFDSTRRSEVELSALRMLGKPNGN